MTRLVAVSAVEVGLVMWTLLCVVVFCASCTNLVWGGASLRDVIHAELLALDAAFDFLQQLLNLDFLSFNYHTKADGVVSIFRFCQRNNHVSVFLSRIAVLSWFYPSGVGDWCG